MSKESLAALIDGCNHAAVQKIFAESMADNLVIMYMERTDDDLLCVRGPANSYAAFGLSAWGGVIRLDSHGAAMEEPPERDRAVLARYGALGVVLERYNSALEFRYMWSEPIKAWAVTCAIPVAHFDVISGDRIYCQEIGRAHV